MKFVTGWLVVPVLFFCVSDLAVAQSSSDESAQSERIAILEAEVSKLRSELLEVRKLILTPKLVLQGKEDYEVRGNSFTRYKLSVENYEVYPDEMFRSAPDLPPCGKNKNAARTWVDIVSADGRKLYGFCAFNSPENLTKLWFAVPKGSPPPSSVGIVLNDREQGTKYSSNMISLNASE